MDITAGVYLANIALDDVNKPFLQNLAKCVFYASFANTVKSPILMLIALLIFIVNLILSVQNLSINFLIRYSWVIIMFMYKHNNFIIIAMNVIVMILHWYIVFKTPKRHKFYNWLTTNALQATPKFIQMTFPFGITNIISMYFALKQLKRKEISVTKLIIMMLRFQLLQLPWFIYSRRHHDNLAGDILKITREYYNTHIEIIANYEYIDNNIDLYLPTGAASILTDEEKEKLLEIKSRLQLNQDDLINYKYHMGKYYGNDYMIEPPKNYLDYLIFEIKDILSMDNNPLLPSKTERAQKDEELLIKFASAISNGNPTTDDLKTFIRDHPDYFYRYHMNLKNYKTDNMLFGLTSNKHEFYRQYITETVGLIGVSGGIGMILKLILNTIK